MNSERVDDIPKTQMHVSFGRSKVMCTRKLPTDDYGRAIMDGVELGGGSVQRSE